MSAAASTAPTLLTTAPATEISPQTGKTLTIDDVWAALPPFFKRENNPTMAAILDNAGPKYAASTYAHLFWGSDADGRPARTISVERLLELMIVLYLYKGGNDPEGETAFWKKIFKIDLVEVAS